MNAVELLSRISQINKKTTKVMNVHDSLPKEKEKKITDEFPILLESVLSWTQQPLLLRSGPGSVFLRVKVSSDFCKLTLQKKKKKKRTKEKKRERSHVCFQ